MKKKIIITISILLVIAIVGVLGVRFFTNFFFDKYFLKTALSSFAEKGDETQGQDEPPQEEKPKGEVVETDKDAETEEEPASPEEEPKKKLSNTEVISRVMKSSELTNKMASMVPYEDKRTVLKIILSNFSEDELAQIAKNASKGLSPAYKSQLIATARARLTYSQWKQCLNIAYKYVDQIRPYVE